MKPNEQGFALQHQIIVLDAYLTRALDSSIMKSSTHAFVQDVLQVLGLSPLGPLEIYPAVDDRAPGWSFIQPITTSHLSAHYFERPGKAPHIRIDAYSCDHIDWRLLLKVCDQHYSFADWRASFIDREIDGYQPRAILDIAGSGNSVSHCHSLTMSAPDRPAMQVA